MYKYLMLFCVCLGCGASNEVPTVDPAQARLAYEWAIEARARRITEDEQIKALIGSANYVMACYDNQPGAEPCIRVLIRK